MEEIKNNENFITKFAQGRYSLPLSFWAFGLSVQAIFYFLGSILSYSKGSFIILIFFEIMTKLWLVVGVWNSGKYYRGNAAWVILSRISIILLCVFTLILYSIIISALLK